MLRRSWITPSHEVEPVGCTMVWFKTLCRALQPQNIGSTPWEVHPILAPDVEGGGEAEVVRHQLRREIELHRRLRLPLVIPLSNGDACLALQGSDLGPPTNESLEHWVNVRVGRVLDAEAQDLVNHRAEPKGDSCPRFQLAVERLEAQGLQIMQVKLVWHTSLEEGQELRVRPTAPNHGGCVRQVLEPVVERVAPRVHAAGLGAKAGPVENLVVGVLLLELGRVHEAPHG
mmetsp:Transcript_76342/g.223862  ORF Transcript_76342/g.223862 Transcript_76342/m.223862 type:complete len:230 (+) Transcript_76342:1293-1982(+)